MNIYKQIYKNNHTHIYIYIICYIRNCLQVHLSILMTGEDIVSNITKWLAVFSIHNKATNNSGLKLH